MLSDTRKQGSPHFRHISVTSTQIRYFNRNPSLQHKSVTSTHHFYTNPLLQHKSVTSTRNSYLNTISSLQHKYVTTCREFHTWRIFVEVKCWMDGFVLQRRVQVTGVWKWGVPSRTCPRKSKFRVCLLNFVFFYFNLFQKLVSLVSRQWPIKSQIMQEFPLTCAITIADKKILTAHVTARNQWYFIINTQAVGWDSGLSSSYFLDDTLESTRSKIS